MKVMNKFYTCTLALFSTAALLSYSRPHMQSLLSEKPDTFERTVSPKGNNSPEILACAPSPKVTVCGNTTNAKFVIDLSHNVLYNYDDSGHAKCAYSIASGKKLENGESLTPKGVRRISHVEKSPYKNVPRSSKRYGNPGGVYGPWLIYTTRVDSKTGAIHHDGICVHGNADEESLGQ